MSVCPEREQLRRFLNNDLDGTVDLAVAEHVERCPSCQQALEGLTESPSSDGAAGPRPAEAPPATWLARLVAAGSNGADLPAAAVLPAEGSRVGPYELLRELGRGGMGVVYVARHTGLNRLVALKMILAGGHAGSAAVARFRAEAEALARLQHPHIVQVHDVGDEAGQPFLVMEYVAGSNLEDHLKGKPLAPRRAAELLCSLADAIAAAHGAGIVHRDLKPANVLLSFDREPPESASAPALAGDVQRTDWAPKITDFGLAKRLDEESRLTQTGLVVGTPSYMAPEQADLGGAVGPAADLWALGAVFYACLTGRPPFLGETAARTLWLAAHDDPLPPSRLQPSVPRDLETICLKCLEKEPARRYLSARALAEDLRRFLGGEPIRARPAKPWEAAWKWARRKPAAAALLAVLLLLTLVGLPSVTALWLQAEQQRREKEQERDRANTARDDLAQERDRVNAARDDLERAIYSSRIVLIQKAYLDNDVTVARALLDRVKPEPGRPDLRGWEWHYLRHLCYADLHPGMRHALPSWSFVDCLAVAPDGRRALTGVSLPIGQRDPKGRDRAHSPGEVRLWDLETGRCLMTRTDHEGAVDAVAFSPDGRFFASGGSPAPGVVRLVELATGQLRSGPPPVAGGIYCLAFAPGGRTLAIAADQSLVLWDCEAARVRHTVTHQPARQRPRIAFRPDGRLLLAVSPGVKGPQAWDPESGMEVALPLPKEPAQAVAFSPDGQLLVLARGKEIEVWDAGSWRMRRRLSGHTQEVNALAFAADGRLASASNDRSIRLWDAAAGRELMVLRGHTGGVTCVGFTPDSRRLVTGDKEQTVKVWDVTHDPQGRSFQVTQLGQLGEWIDNLVFAADSRSVRVADRAKNEPHNRVRRWDVAASRLLEVKSLSALGPWSRPFRSDVTFSADSGRVAAALSNESGSVRVCAADSGTEVSTVRTGAASIMTLALTAAGRRLAYLADPGKQNKAYQVGIVDLTTAQTQARIDLPPGHYVAVACFSADERLLAGVEVTGADKNTLGEILPRGDIVLWDADTGEERQRLRRIDPVPQPRLALSPDGRRLALADLRGSVRVWDLKTGALAFPILRTAAGLTGVAYSPDGERLAVAGLHNCVHLYDAVAGHELLKLPCLGRPGTGHYGFISRVVFSPDGNHLAANGWDGELTIWSAGPEK